jgi:asparagine synthase (glutamine-hydrolysing)
MRTFADGQLILGWTGSREGDVLLTREVLCVVDGTLYNRGELAADVGVHPRSGSAAVVAAAWMRWGQLAFERLRGDFVVLLWRREMGKGLVVRDQMGGRGLAFAQQSGSVFFGSEPATVLELLPSVPAPDDVAVAHWIAVGGQPGGRTLFSGLRRLEAGHLLTIDSGTAVPRRYWAPRYQAPDKAPRDEVVARLRSELRRAVGRRAGTGERIGVLMSGGLDSATVGGIAALELGEDKRVRRSYSAVFPDLPGVDESEQIDTLTVAYGLDSARIAVRSGSVVVGSLPYLARWRLPPASPNMFFWNPLLERAAADGVGVLLDGEGGDELFGLSPYLLADRVRRGRLLSALSLAVRMPGTKGPHMARRVARRLRRFGMKGAAPLWMHAAARRVHGAAHYAPDWMRSETAGPWLETETDFRWKHLDGPLWWSYLVEATTRGIGPDLVYDQSRCRGSLTGIEPRHPLVDVDVLDFVLSLPPELAFDSRYSRPLLRDAMAGLVPDPVRLRGAKSNFDAVFHRSMAGGDLPVTRQLLCDPAARIGAYVDLRAMREALLDPDPPGRLGSLSAWAINVWRLLTLEVWLRAQEGPEIIDELAGASVGEAAELQILDVRLAGGPVVPARSVAVERKVHRLGAFLP